MRRFLCLLGVVLLVACNSVLDIPEAHPRTEESPNVPDPDGDDDPVDCGDGQKSCQGRCVETDDPSTGCGGASCEPCAVANAQATCAQGKCAVGSCTGAFLNCNEDASDGCEINSATDPLHCGDCKNDCEGDLTCGDSGCHCDADEQCGFNGGCNTDESVCICGQKSNGDDRQCSLGAPCDGEDSCEF